MHQHTPQPRESIKYRRIAASLRTEIMSASLAPGAPLPSITRLVERHRCSRQTCGRALRMLERDGLVTRLPGLGYRVTDPAEGL